MSGFQVISDKVGIIGKNTGFMLIYVQEVNDPEELKDDFRTIYKRDIY